MTTRQRQARMKVLSSDEESEYHDASDDFPNKKTSKEPDEEGTKGV